MALPGPPECKSWQWTVLLLLMMVGYAVCMPDKHAKEEKGVQKQQRHRQRQSQQQRRQTQREQRAQQNAAARSLQQLCKSRPAFPLTGYLKRKVEVLRLHRDRHQGGGGKDSLLRFCANVTAVAVVSAIAKAVLENSAIGSMFM